MSPLRHVGLFEETAHDDNDQAAIYSIEGRIQRVNYQTRELRVTAEGHP